MKIIKPLFFMDILMKTNGFLYYLSLLPLIGNVAHQFMNMQNHKLKVNIGIVINLIKNILVILLKVLISFLFIIVPVSFLTSQQIVNGEINSNLNTQFFIMFFCFLGAFNETNIFTSTKQKYSFFKYFKAPAKTTILSLLKIEYSIQFVSMAIVCTICDLFFNIGIFDWLAIWILYIFLHLMGEVLFLHYFKKKSIILSKKKIYALLIYSILIIGLIYPIVFANPIFIIDVISLPIVMIFMIITIIPALIFIVKYSCFEKITDFYLNADELLSVAIKKSLEKDMEISANKTAFDEIAFSTYNDTGINLLDNIFNTRFKKVLLKPVKIRAMIFLILTASTFFISYFFPTYEIGNVIANLHNLTALLPLFLFPFAYGEYYCRTSYTKCDSALLNYAFFTSKQTLFFIVKKRLIYVVLKNMLLGGVLLICYNVLLLINRQNPLEIDRIYFMFTIMVLFITFGVHHVTLYVSFQPYTVGNIAPNPIIAVSQMFILMVSVFLMRAPFEAVAVTVILTAFCIIYIISLLIIIYVRAPKHFIVR